MLEKCPLCRSRLAGFESGKSPEGVVQVNCPKCGNFEYLRGEAVLQVDGADALRPFIASYIRQQNKAGVESVRINRDWPEFARAQERASVSERLYLLLKWCCLQSARPGQLVDLEAFYPETFVGATDSGEFSYLKTALVTQGLIENKITGFLVTPAGWERISDRDRNALPRTAFVAMSFNPDVMAAFSEGIAPALRECGFVEVRLDRIEHNDNINDRIIADIRASHIVVADFTGHTRGVYFEAGFALGLGKPVVWTCKESELKNAHFDTRSYNHVAWTTEQELRERLVNRIRATIRGARLG